MGSSAFVSAPADNNGKAPLMTCHEGSSMTDVVVYVQAGAETLFTYQTTPEQLEGMVQHLNA